MAARRLMIMTSIHDFYLQGLYDTLHLSYKAIPELSGITVFSTE